MSRLLSGKSFANNDSVCRVDQAIGWSLLCRKVTDDRAGLSGTRPLTANDPTARHCHSQSTLRQSLRGGRCGSVEKPGKNRLRMTIQ